MTACAYCGIRRGNTTDHLITRAAARRSGKAAFHRQDEKFKVRACLQCNVAKGTLLRVPESHAHLIAELEQITLSKYQSWNGEARSLYGEDR